MMTGDQPQPSPQPRRTPSDLHIRLLIRRDWPEVMAIEKAAFDQPWSLDEFEVCLRQRNCVGMVAEIDEGIVGYMVYTIEKDHIQLLNFAVSPEFQRYGIGTAMVEKLKKKLQTQNRRRLALEVRETNLAMQLFLRANGFLATDVVRDLFHDIGEDGYLMEWVL